MIHHMQASVSTRRKKANHYLQELAKVLTRVLVLLILCTVAAPADEQRNIVFRGAPDFLKDSWDIVLAANSDGSVRSISGAFTIGNDVVSLRDSPAETQSKDVHWIEVSSVKMVNVGFNDTPSGYITVFELKGRDAVVVLQAEADFWTISIREGGSGAFAVYLAVKRPTKSDMKEAGLYEARLASWRTFLSSQYRSLSQGLD